MPKELPEPFRPSACQRLRKLATLRSDCVVKKQRATKNRDEIQDQINECDRGNTRRLNELKSLHYDECAAIKECNNAIHACAERMIETIEHGDDLVDTIDPNPTLRTLFDASGSGDVGGDDDDDEQEGG